MASFASWLNSTKTRGLIIQAALVALVGLLVWEMAANAVGALQRQHIATGFDFLKNTAGFGITQTLIDYTEQSTYGRALLVGLLNTALVSILGIILATIVGFAVGIGRLSKNWVVAKVCTVYVEVLRNTPLLLQLFFWYFGVLRTLPGPRQSLDVAGTVFVNNRGLFLPSFGGSADGGAVLAAAFIGIVAAILVVTFGRSREPAAKGKGTVWFIAVATAIAFPLIAWFTTAQSYTVEVPELRGFNFVGGIHILPELLALLVGLATYTASYIAEIVRAGILGVSKGQTEAASALGLSRWQQLRLVVIPQALRIIIPPLTSEYLSLTKNSSLAVAVGYPDLVAVFTGTTLNQTGQAIEIIAITMGIYLAFSLGTAAIMNWYNARIKLAGDLR